MPLDGAVKNKIQPKALTLNDFRPGAPDKPFLIISYGGGNDSTAVLLLLAKLGIRPDLILMADTGAERKYTYAYLPVINRWLESVSFPQVTVISAARSRDRTIEANAFRLGVFAGLSYGTHTCSVQWKIEAQQKWLKSYLPYLQAKKEKRTIARMIGFNADEIYRAERADKNAAKKTADADGCKRSTSFAAKQKDGSVSMFPLIEMGIDFDGVLEMIWSAGLPLPGKSSCHFCAAMTSEEIHALAKDEPQKFFRSLVLERVVQRNKVRPAERVIGINYGTPWGEMEIAREYMHRLEEVIEFFGLDRAIEDGINNPKNQEWRPKAARVEIFLDCFSTAENLRAFMNNTLDLDVYAAQLAQTKIVPTGVQMSLGF